MSEGLTFSDLVREAFIDPLRSVLIIDDQYPTWEEILNGVVDEHALSNGMHDGIPSKQWRTNPAAPLSVIKQFRGRNPGFVIDIHDAELPPKLIASEASETPTAIADHLHQSDLLVLDYNLEGESSGLGGTLARIILQTVLRSKHFNLVVIHTGEHDLNQVLYDCLLSLMMPCSSEFSERLQLEIEILNQKLQEMEDEGDFDRKQLHMFFGINEYIQYRLSDGKRAELIREYMRGQGDLAALGDLATRLALKPGERRSFLCWAIREFEKERSTLFSSAPHEGLAWMSATDCKWLRTVGGFVTFVGKGSKDLIDELLRALESWQPNPSRLLSAKYRHELNRIGVEAEDRTLLKSHVFAHFYSDICNLYSQDLTEPARTRLTVAKLKEHVARQSEAISFHIENEIVGFGEKIIKADMTAGNLFSTFYGVDLSDSQVKRTAVAHYNSYISTLPLKKVDDQLDSGHILDINGEWWVCATPACDLQPNQNTIAFIGNSDDLRPFTALRLNKVDIQCLSPGHINSGEYCFVEDEPGEIVALGLRLLHVLPTTPPSDKVTWRTFLAKSGGLIQQGHIGLIRPKLQATNLVTEETSARVVSKLRYEYALNYIQKVGASVSRIGLGYTSVMDDE
ncbi:response regulator receiver domain [Cellvibrio sp. ARAG 10.3]|uniref:response regulator receiver domain n=1 Tax=Cellvibrio sp. ARAG 10.3 TaxID=3451358 RepID=UPI003F47A7D0